MTNKMHTDDERQHFYPLTRRTILQSIPVAAGVTALGGIGAIGSVAAQEGENGDGIIETCDEPLDVVLALDYSGSIRSAGVWEDIRQGADEFIDVLSDENQIGLLTFGDSPRAYDLTTDGSGDYLVPATSGNRVLAKGNVPTSAPPQENATHIPGAIDYSTDVLEAEGRGVNEVLIIVTDGGPNYENGTVGNGDDDPVASGFQGPDDDVVVSAPLTTHTYTGGSTGGENGNAGEPGELTETAAVAAAARARGTRVVAVFFGPADFDQFFKDEVVTPSETDQNFVRTTADQVGATLVNLLSEVCPECAVCEADGQLAKYEYVFSDDGDIVDAFVLDGSGSGFSYDSYVSKNGEMGEPMTATFDTEYCEVYALVKAGQEFSVQLLEAEDGQVTAESVAPYAISFVAFYCTEEAAQAAADAFPSNGKGGGNDGGGRPDDAGRPDDVGPASGGTQDRGTRDRGQGRGRGRGQGRGRGRGRVRGR